MKIGGNHIKVNEPGPEISLKEQKRLIDFIKQISKPDDLWVVSGSIPCGVDSNIYAKLIKMIHELNGIVFLDTSGNALLSALQEKPELVKPNLSELEEITESTLDTLKDIQSAIHEVPNELKTNRDL